MRVSPHANLHAPVTKTRARSQPSGGINVTVSAASACTLPPIPSSDRGVPSPSTTCSSKTWSKSRYGPLQPASTGTVTSAVTLGSNPEEPAAVLESFSILPTSRSSNCPSSSCRNARTYGQTPDKAVPTASMERCSRHESLPEVGGSGAFELAERDERPTFLIDLTKSAEVHGQSLGILYMNANLKGSQSIYDLVAGHPYEHNPGDEFNQFRSWAHDTSWNKQGEGVHLSLPYHMYGGIFWTWTTLKQQYRLVSANISPRGTGAATKSLISDDRLSESDYSLLRPESTSPTEGVDEQREAQVTEYQRQQEDLIDVTGHEMRNPLSAVLQCADQIVHDISEFTAHQERPQVEALLERCLDAAHTINLCAAHQHRVVNDIIILSKLNSGLLSVNPVDGKPVRLVQRTLDMFKSELAAHHIELEVEIDDIFENMDIEWSKIDPPRFRQVLINLISNAIKYTQGQERKKITVSLGASKSTSEAAGTGRLNSENRRISRAAVMGVNKHEWETDESFYIHCSVKDTGSGFDAEELKALFQHPQRAIPRSHAQYDRSYLGLFIAKTLTEMQGGQINVASEACGGSKFSFYIQSHKSTHPRMEQKAISGSKSAGHKEDVSAIKPVPQLGRTVSHISNAPKSPEGHMTFDILIVEDNLVNQKVLQRQLQNYGNNTLVANHGREALDILHKSRCWAGQESKPLGDISVILMDLEMPVMGGLACTRRIRELEEEGVIAKHIPIIAVTAYVRAKQVKAAMAAGVDDVVSKPFRVSDLMPNIEDLVNRYKDC